MGYKSQNIRSHAGGLRVSEAVSKAERRFEIWRSSLFSAFHHPGPVSDLRIESRSLLR